LAFHSGREADHSPPSSAEVKEWVELYLHSPNTPSWRGAQLGGAQGQLYLTFTYKLTPWNTVLLDKLTVTQLVKKFPAFYGPRRFIALVSPSLVPILSQMNQSTPSHPISVRSIPILSSHRHLFLPSGLFPSGLLTKILYALLTSLTRVTCPAHLTPPWLDHPNNN
jgi:hypothetical protein